MLILNILSFVVGGFFVYGLGGALTVIATAYLHKRLTGRDWFAGHYATRWAVGQQSNILPAPVFVFAFWPIMIPASIFGFIVSGMWAATEKLGDKVIKIADEQRKTIGSFRE